MRAVFEYTKGLYAEDGSEWCPKGQWVGISEKLILVKHYKKLLKID